MGTLELRDIRVDVIVGVLDVERREAQPISIDILIERPFKKAAKRDELSESTDYTKAIDLAAAIAERGRYQLLEALATAIANGVLELDEKIEKVEVLVRKMRVPATQAVGSVGARVTATR